MSKNIAKENKEEWDITFNLHYPWGNNTINCNTCFTNGNPSKEELNKLSEKMKRLFNPEKVDLINFRKRNMA